MAYWIGSMAVFAVATIGFLWRYRSIQKELQRVKSLFELTLNINSTLMKDALLDTIMTQTANILHAQASSVILVDQLTGELYFELATGEKGADVKEIRLKKGEGIAGWVANSGESVKIDDVTKDPRWSRKVDTKVEHATRNMLCVPITSRGEVIGVLQVINKKNGKPFTDADLELLKSMAAPIAIALENAFLYEALEKSIQTLKETTAVKERMESELNIAREIQMSFLPSKLPFHPLYELASFIRPAREVGGDFYNYYMLDEQHLFFVLGDVSDKGVPASVFMTVTLTLFKASVLPGITPGALLQKVNQELYSDESTMFATVFCGIMNVQTGEVLFSNAGHCVPYIRYADGHAATLPMNKGIPLAVLPDSTYMDEWIKLKPGDSLLIYTDGISEAEKENHEMFGMDNIKRCLERNDDASAQDTVERLIQDVDKFTEGFAQFDDIAMMLIKRKRSPQP